jgi:hypothetical protein
MLAVTQPLLMRHRLVAHRKARAGVAALCLLLACTPGRRILRAIPTPYPLTPAVRLTVPAKRILAQADSISFSFRFTNESTDTVYFNPRALVYMRRRPEGFHAPMMWLDSTKTTKTARQLIMLLPGVTLTVPRSFPLDTTLLSAPETPWRIFSLHPCPHPRPASDRKWCGTLLIDSVIIVRSQHAGR